MKSKIKECLSWVKIVLIVFIIYMIFTISIKKIIPTYENNISSFSNKEENIKGQTIISLVERYYKELSKYDEKDKQILSEEEEKEILENETIKAFQNYNKDNTPKGELAIIRDKTDYGKLFSLVQEKYAYKLVFSKDLKNITFYSYIYENGQVKDNNNLEIKKEDIIENIKEIVKQLKIPLENEFLPTSIYLDKYQVGNIYSIEDEKNHLELSFNADTKTIERLAYGFIGIEDKVQIEVEKTETDASIQVN